MSYDPRQPPAPTITRENPAFTACSTETCQRQAAIDLHALALCRECFMNVVSPGRYRTRVIWTDDHKVERVVAVWPDQAEQEGQGPVRP
jgi:hypothetical protein